MIKSISFVHYRRLKAPLSLSFIPKINVISGMNGTCKSSILYLISNAFQAEKGGDTSLLKDSKKLRIINSYSGKVNAKIEFLTKGDKTYNDPAPGQTGALYSITYNNGIKIDFRRHNSKNEKENSNKRFRLIPNYSKEKQGLPILRVVYLSLTRLMPYGEIDDNTQIKTIKNELPDQYNTLFHKLVEEITTIKITESTPQIVAELKTRSEYQTNEKGIDSNTVSAGEDNIILILKNLILLRYYYDQLKPEEQDKPVCSILLIDELDATLHPAMQLRLLRALINYSEAYKIQIFFTTHSLYLLEKLLQYKEAKELIKVNYLTHQVDHVALLPDPSINKIESHLQELVKSSYLDSVRIPIFTEDSEARFILQGVFGYFREYCNYFKIIERYFHFVEAQIGCNVLKQIFSDTYLDKNTMNAICILDGDQSSQKKTARNIIALPGKNNPEQTLFLYIKELMSNNEFWHTPAAMEKGLTKKFTQDVILKDIDQIEIELSNKKKEGESTKGNRRQKSKDIFSKHKESIEIFFNHWLDHHYDQLNSFYNDLRFCFRQVALLHKLDPEMWPLSAQLSGNKNAGQS